MITWEIQKRNIEDLIGYDKNPRKFTDKGLKDLKKSLQNCGDANIITINADNTVLGGHARLTVMKQLGYKEVDVKVPTKQLTEKQVQEVVVRLNANTAGEWDLEKLEADFNLDELQEWGLDIEFNTEEEPQEVIEDEVPEEVETRAKLGDIWQLGEHRLMCGDSTSVTDVEKLMDGEKADMVFTDPPYGVDYKGINNDSRSGLEQLLDDAFANMIANSKAGASVYCFHSDKCADIFHKIFRQYCHFSSMIIWKKQSLVLSQTDYQSIHEPCLYGWFNNGTHLFFADRKQTSVWEYERKNVDGHTTPKPIDLIANALRNSSKKDNNILDLFGGSGSTLIACEQLNRKCFMMELDPHYVDVIITRWENLTGQKAVLCS